MKRATSKGLPSLSAAQLGQLNALEGRALNTAAIPEAPAEKWQNARQFFKPTKEPSSVRADADVLDWLRRRSDRYQVEINRILRTEMEAEASN